MRGAATRLGASGLLLVTLLCWLTMVASYQNKARCVGPSYDSLGRTEPAYQVRKDRDVCYSDVQHLWIGRDIDRHVFPYVHGGIDAGGSLYGGAVEYPVLTGLLMWAGALFAHTDGAFLLGTALLLAPFGLLVGYLLGALTGWRSLLWALGPPLFLYAFHNWDLPAVACTVAAIWVMHRPGAASVVRRGCWAGVLLGLGFAVKLYPAMFLAPLALYVLTSGARARFDWAGTLRVVGGGGRHGGRGEPAVRPAGLPGMAGRVHLPRAAQGGPDHQLNLVLGLPADLRPGQHELPGDGGLGLAGRGAELIRGGARRRLVAVPAGRRLPVDPGERGHAGRVPAVAQGALAAVRPVDTPVLRVDKGALEVDSRVLRRRPGDGRRHLPLLLRGVHPGHGLRDLLRPCGAGRDGRGVGAGGLAGRPVRGVPVRGGGRQRHANTGCSR